MKQLSTKQRELVSMLSARLGAIDGMRAVVLGGSHARGRARADSDLDLGLFYSEAAPFAIDAIRALAAEVNDTPAPVVTDFYGWGRWVNGGSWLTIQNQRVDFIYRSLEHVERVITNAEAGGHEIDYPQQPPFGFFSGTYLGEIAVCIPLFDPEERLVGLKQRVAVYPEPLRRAIVQDYLWSAEFTLAAFAPKYAAHGDVYGTAACLTSAISKLVLVLFALNRAYLMNEKTSLLEIAEFQRVPPDFASRVQSTLAHLGGSRAELDAGVARIVDLLREIVALTEGIYAPRFVLPK